MTVLAAYIIYFLACLSIAAIALLAFYIIGDFRRAWKKHHDKSNPPA